MDTRVVTTHVPVELAEKLDELAELLDRPKGWVVKEAIAAYVALEEKRHQLTLEALEDVDKGRVLEHEQIEAWIDGLEPVRKKRQARR